MGRREMTKHAQSYDSLTSLSGNDRACVPWYTSTPHSLTFTKMSLACVGTVSLVEGRNCFFLRSSGVKHYSYEHLPIHLTGFGETSDFAHAAPISAIYFWPGMMNPCRKKEQWRHWTRALFFDYVSRAPHNKYRVSKNKNRARRRKSASRCCQERRLRRCCWLSAKHFPRAAKHVRSQRFNCCAREFIRRFESYVIQYYREGK